LISSHIREHDRREQFIRLNLMPDELSVNDNCKIFILSSPVPCEFLGKVKKISGSLMIALFQGYEKENRGAMRYAVNSPAFIEALVIENKAYSLQNNVQVNLINISTSGVRFRAPYYSFVENDIFRMRLMISNSEKQITAEVLNCMDKDKTTSDYGCRFVEII